MISMEKKFTPKRTILGLMFLNLILVTIGYDRYNRTRIEDIILSSIRTSNILVHSNNYQFLSLNLNSLKELNPFVTSFGIYVDGEIRTGSGGLPSKMTVAENFPEDSVQVSLKGFFTYQCFYVFSNTQNLFFSTFSDPNRYIILMLLYLVVILCFGLIYWLSSVLDVDRIQEQALKYVLSLSGRTLHGLKTHMMHSNALYNILTKNGFNLTDEQKMVINDFDLSRIEMDGHMSIIRLESFKKCSSYLDVKESLMVLINAYKKPAISFDLHCNHRSPLLLDQDIFTATAGNIIKNAFDFADQMVRITTKEEDQKLKIVVFNTGKKIPKEKIKKIFKPGFTDGGTGLGLSIAKAWLDKLGASIELNSNAAGTAVEIIFPLGEAPIKQETSLKKQEISYIAANHKSDLILAIVEDVPSFRIGLSNLLNQLGVETIQFESIKDFLDVLEKKPAFCHGVIVDRHLRGEDAVRDRFPDSCRYLGFKGSLILYSCDPSDTKNSKAKNNFDFLLPKDETIDWQSIINRLKLRA